MTKQLHNFIGMQLVKDEYTNSGMSDSEFAANISARPDRSPYSTAQVRSYRQALGIPNNVQTTVTVKAQLDEAKRLLQNVLGEVAFDSTENETYKRIKKFLGVE